MMEEASTIPSKMTKQITNCDNVSSLQTSIQSAAAMKLELQRENQALRQKIENLQSDMTSRLQRASDRNASVRRSRRYQAEQARTRFALIQELKADKQALKHQMEQERNLREEAEKKCAKAEEKCAKAVRERHNLQSKVSYHRTKPATCPNLTLVDRKVKQLKVREELSSRFSLISPFFTDISPFFD